MKKKEVRTTQPSPVQIDTPQVKMRTSVILSSHYKGTPNSLRQPHLLSPEHQIKMLELPY